MRREEFYLQDIVDATDAISQFVAGMSCEQFVATDLHRSAVMHKLTAIGEAAASIDRAFRDSHPSVPWASIIRFRNLAVHAYFGIHWGYTWGLTQRQVPDLRTAVVDILAAEFPSNRGGSG